MPLRQSDANRTECNHIFAMFRCDLTMPTIPDDISIDVVPFAMAEENARDGYGRRRLMSFKTLKTLKTCTGTLCDCRGLTIIVAHICRLRQTVLCRRTCTVDSVDFSVRFNFIAFARS